MMHVGVRVWWNYATKQVKYSRYHYGVQTQSVGDNSNYRPIR